MRYLEIDVGMSTYVWRMHEKHRDAFITYLLFHMHQKKLENYMNVANVNELDVRDIRYSACHIYLNTWFSQDM